MFYLFLYLYVFILMMQPGVQPEYLLKLDTHKHTIINAVPVLYKTSAAAETVHIYL